MKKAFAMLLLSFVTMVAYSGDHVPGGNRKPKITGQKDLSVREDESITVTLFDLQVRDRDDWYPFGFSMKLYPGDNYTLSGSTVIPNANYSGELSVPATVNDGQDDSEIYPLKIQVRSVNDPPVIKGQNLISTEQGEPISLTASHLIIEDVDDKYPDDFRVNVISGSTSDYSVSGNTITPSATYEGTINIELNVSDGELTSNNVIVSISVHRKNYPPVINGQVPLATNEDEPITIQFGHLLVSDPDDSYPTGFTMRIEPGNNYSVTGTTVAPLADYSGNLYVGVVVSDGKKESNQYSLNIIIRPVNDLPTLVDLEIDPLFYKIGEGEESVTEKADVVDPDNDSIVSAQVRIQRDRYQVASDELLFQNTSRIKGEFAIQTGILTLKGIASHAEYTSAIRSIRYNFITAAQNQFKEKAIEFILNDGRADGPVTRRTINFSDLDVALDIPNAFTPNGDRANDTWQIKPLKQAEELTNAIIRVYTKSGQLVFEGKGFEKAWDGRLNGELLPADTYYYTIDLNLKISKSLKKGLVTLLR
jgi:gliding motility-associated-like protein